MTSDERIIEARQVLDATTRALGVIVLRRRNCEISPAEKVVAERDLLRDALGKIGKILLK